MSGVTASTIIAAAGTAMSAIGSIQQGNAAKSAADYNAGVERNNAELERRNATLAGQKGAVDTEMVQQRTRAGLGEIKAAQAAKGIDVNTESAVDVQSSAAELGELNAITVRSNAVREAYGHQTAEASDKAQAQLDKQQGNYAQKAGYINAAGTLLGNIGKGGQEGLWGTHTNSTALNSDDIYSHGVS